MRRALLGCCLWGLASACRPHHVNIENPPADVTLYGVRAQNFRGGELTATGRAERLVFDRSDTHFVAYGARMFFPRPNVTSGQTQLDAPEVRGVLSQKQADGLGGVVLRTDTGLVGKTATAHFDGVAMTAAGREPISLVGKGYATNAREFLFHLRDSTFEFSDASSTFGGAKK